MKQHLYLPNSAGRKGFTLIGVLLAVGVVSLVAMGISVAVTNGVDGMSHMRNVALAEDVSGLVSGLMGDPDYCRAHFGGQTIGSTLPSVIASSVVFKEISSGGTLGAGDIIKPGTKYQNVLEVQSISLKAENVIGPHRYLGSLNLTLKGNTGYGLYFNRSIPLQIATDMAGKITDCSRAAEVVHGTTQGVWSETCDDFAAKGWPAKDSCLKDGRWHKVYSHTSTGTPTYGSMSALIKDIDEGADVKVSIPAGGFVGTADAHSERCVSTIRDNGMLLCLGSARLGVTDWVTPVSDATGGVVYYSTGRLIYHAPSTVVNVPLNWHVKF